jgi:pilus assembly protein CpaB|nr:Flp pilus assembly protein RcpC/CpaB [uncultured bacterium]
MLGSETFTARGNRAMLVLALGLGLISALLVYAAIRVAGGRAGGGGGEGTAVVVAAQDIPARTRITADMVRVTEVPSDLLTPGAFTRPADVIGKTARFPIAAREQLTKEKLAETSLSSDVGRDLPLAIQIPQGKRAVAIKIDEEKGVGGLVLPGDFVDVIGVFEVRSGEGGSRQLVSMVVVQNVEVLAVAQQTAELPPDAGDLSPEERVNLRAGEPDPDARTVTLAVTPQQAQVLALAAERGSLRLSLRSFGDTGQLSPGPVPSNLPLGPDLSVLSNAP